MIYMFLAEGFEEVEALCPLDLMRRAGLAVTTVGIGGLNITGAHGITVKADIPDTQYEDDTPELVFLPGGMPGTLNLAKSPVVERAIRAALSHNAYLAAICAAPSILGDMGLLRGKEAVCYPGFEERLLGAVYVSDGVVTDGNVTTARGMGFAIDLGLELVKLLSGEEQARNLKAAIQHNAL